MVNQVTLTGVFTSIDDHLTFFIIVFIVKMKVHLISGENGLP
jgi:hypothetical protein